MYKVTSDLKLKVQGVIKVFPVGSVIKLPEEAAKVYPARKACADI